VGKVGSPKNPESAGKKRRGSEWVKVAAGIVNIIESFHRAYANLNQDKAEGKAPRTGGPVKQEKKIRKPQGSAEMLSIRKKKNRKKRGRYVVKVPQPKASNDWKPRGKKIVSNAIAERKGSTRPVTAVNRTNRKKD